MSVLHGMPTAELVREWEQLATQRDAPVFRHPSWVLAWKELLAPNADTAIITAREGDRLVGLLPLARQRRRLHARLPTSIQTWSIAGSGVGAADHVGALGANDGTLEKLFQQSAIVVGGTPLILDGLSADHLTTARRALDVTEIARRRAPVLRWVAGEDPRAAGSKKLWQEIARMRRRLADAGVVGTWHGPGEEQAAVMYRLVKLHRERWAMLGQAGLFDEAKVRLFLELAKQSSDGITGPWVYEMRTRDNSIGAILCIRCPGQVVYYQGGWAPEWGKFSLGKVMVGAAIEFAADNGARTFDFLRGAEPYKYRFGGTDAIDVVAIAGRGVTYRALLARERLAERRRARAARSATVS